MKWLLLIVLPLAYGKTADYTRLNSSCKPCVALDKLVNKHNEETSSDARFQLALQAAKLIKAIDLKGKPELERRRTFYFAMNASLQVLPDDFDSESVVQLLDLRPKAPADFDYVFWRLPINQQRKLAERMRAFKEDKIRPNAQIPEPKEIEEP